MKIKSKSISLVLVAALAALFSACVGTPQQIAATGVYAIGEDVATRLINAGVAPATVKDIAAKLALVPGGTLTPTDYGTLSGEVQIVRDALGSSKSSGAVPATGANYANIDAFLSGVATGNAAVSAGRAPTVNEGIAQAVVTQFTNGLTDGVAFALARNAAIHPAQ